MTSCHCIPIHWLLMPIPVTVAIGQTSRRTPRVRVAARQLQQWYRTLDQLLACKAQVEYALFVRLRDLFSLQVDMVFYDLTSTYFEGRGPIEMGAHGQAHR